MTEALSAVLYVEDEPLVALAVVMELEEAGFEVAQAATGKEALEAIERNRGKYLALVTDVRLPEVDGWSIARRARELNPKLPVIYASGDSGLAWSQEGVPASVMFKKPFANEVLVETLRRLIASTTKSANAY
jgi:DNA-binding response OmpR family regulator